MQMIEFIDLEAQRRHIGPAMDAAIARVLAHGKYILGPEVDELEQKLAAFCGAKHCITCANGTDALALVVMAEGLGPRDAVLVPSFTFAATGGSVAGRGVAPVLVDVDEATFNMSPQSLEAGIERARAADLTPRMVIAVDLFGQAADYPAIERIAKRHGLVVVADAAQSFGASLQGRKVGSFGRYTTVSFFPAKPLGCYGDGGAIFTDDDKAAELLRSLRFHGKGRDKYENVRVGTNSRLDTLQAAILLQKLAVFAEEIEKRDRVAATYGHMLGNHVVTPRLAEGANSVWAQYTLTLPEGTDRDAFQARCKAAGVPTNVYYPRPLHRQQAFSSFLRGGSLEVSERHAGRVVSIPMHPYLDEATQRRISDAVIGALG